VRTGYEWRVNENAMREENTYPPQTLQQPVSSKVEEARSDKSVPVVLWRLFIVILFLTPYATDYFGSYCKESVS